MPPGDGTRIVGGMRTWQAVRIGTPDRWSYVVPGAARRVSLAVLGPVNGVLWGGLAQILPSVFAAAHLSLWGGVVSTATQAAAQSGATWVVVRLIRRCCRAREGSR
jgi:hypothetical protein